MAPIFHNRGWLTLALAGACDSKSGDPPENILNRRKRQLVRDQGVCEVTIAVAAKK